MVAKKKHREEYVVKHVTSLRDGTYVIEHPDGRLERKKSQTDWKKVDALTEEEIEAAVTSDPDWQEFADLDWSKAVLVMPPKKKAISIRVDEDVLAYFKSEGGQYQRRINAVLRSYVQHKKSKTKKQA